MHSIKKPGFQTDINGLRGVAVLLVVLYHFNIGVFKGGFIGVDIFFVISGYLMTKILFTSLDQGRFSYIEFLYRRAVRILPALFSLIFILLLLGAFLLPPPDLNSLAVQSVQALVFNSNNYYAAQQGYFSTGIDNRWLLHTWSLAVEWQFYMIFPLIMFLGWTVAGASAKRHLYLSGLLLLIAAASFVYCLSIDNEISFFSVTARCWQMLSGGLIFMLSLKMPASAKNARVLSYLGTLITVISIFLIKYLDLEASWPDAFSMLPVVGACLIIYSAYENNIILSNKTLQKIGDASYSIYLWHWPVVIALTITGVLYTEPKLAKICGFIASLALGYASFRFIEPMRTLKTLQLRFGLFRLLSTGVVLVCASLAVTYSAGLAFRVQDQENLTRLQAADNSHTFDPNCENTELHGIDNFCYINKEMHGDKVLVIGDSHAGHLYSWFKENSRISTTFFVKSGCPMIVGFERMGKFRNCHDYAEKAYAMAASGLYKTVIISENWTGYGNTSAELCRSTGSSCTTSINDKNGKLPEQQMKETIENILSKNITVVVVDATPYFDFNVPRKLWRDQYWFGKSAPYFSASHFFDKNKGYDKIFNDLRVNANFHVLSFRPQICKETSCAIYDEDAKLAIFKDNDHFNPEWIQKNGQIFLPFTTLR